MGPERSVLTQEQVAQAEKRIGITHPVISTLRAQRPRILELNEERFKLSNAQEDNAFVANNFGFLADAIEAVGDFSLEPLDIVAIWGEADEMRIHGYALVMMVSSTYAIQGLENPVWKGLPRHLLETGTLPEEGRSNQSDLLHIKTRLQQVGESVDELGLYMYGGKDPMVLAIELARRIKEGDEDAKREHEELTAYQAEHKTPILGKIRENFGNKLSYLATEVEMALSDLEEPPLPARALELASQASEIVASSGVREQTQFGNNFYYLFDGIRLSLQVESGQLTREKFEAKAQFEIYLTKAWGYGEVWTEFTRQNADLLAEINDVLEDFALYKDLIKYSTELLKARKLDKEEAFEKSIHPELGGEAIGIVVWNRLNPLLEKAADAMREVGINPQEFYG